MADTSGGVQSGTQLAVSGGLVGRVAGRAPVRAAGDRSGADVIRSVDAASPAGGMVTVRPAILSLVRATPAAHTVRAIPGCAGDAGARRARGHPGDRRDAQHRVRLPGPNGTRIQAGGGSAV